MVVKIDVKSDSEARDELNKMLDEWRDSCRKGT